MNLPPLPPRVSSSQPDLLVRVALMLLAGALHLLAGLMELTHVFAHGLFILFAGVAEIGWVVAARRSSTRRTLLVGSTLATTLIIPRVITRILPAPFSGERERVDPLGIAVQFF